MNLTCGHQCRKYWKYHKYRLLALEILNSRHQKFELLVEATLYRKIDIKILLIPKLSSRTANPKSPYRRSASSTFRPELMTK